MRDSLTLTFIPTQITEVLSTATDCSAVHSISDSTLPCQSAPCLCAEGTGAELSFVHRPEDAADIDIAIAVCKLLQGEVQAAESLLGFGPDAAGPPDPDIQIYMLVRLPLL